MRYQFYREHKYVSSALNDLERLIARTDFCNPHSVKEVEQAFESLASMLQGHAHYENERLHMLLKQKNALIFEHIEKDHAAQDDHLLQLKQLLHAISLQTNPEDKIAQGYHFYLTYRKFVADNLTHLHEEETEILPELQKLYSDAELRHVEAETYREMTAAEMIEMLETLFPHMNTHDKRAFLSDIRTLAPEKFDVVHKAIEPHLTEKTCS